MTESTQRSAHRHDIEPFDVSRAELYAEYKWQEPFRRLRAEAPVYHCAQSAFGPYWVVSSYKTIEHVESLPDIYSSSWEHGGITVADIDDSGDTVSLPMFIAMDRPQHTEQRKVVAPAFMPSEMARMSDDIRKRTGEILDALPLGTAFDWVDKVAIELTIQMLAILFDFPWADRRKLIAWSDYASNVEYLLDPEKAKERMSALYEMAGYFQNLWNERQNKPQTHDLISMMIHSESMSHMSQNEFIGNIALLIVAGNDTTRNSMSGLALGLHMFPDQRAKLEADTSLIPNAVNEIIRWQTPVAHMRRTATQDTELDGHHIKKGDKVVMWYVSGNRDETVFPDADKLNIERDNARRHLSFGYGAHRCIGARLAELQLSILLQEMIKRRLRVTVIGEPVRMSQSFINGFVSMQVELARY